MTTGSLVPLPTPCDLPRHFTQHASRPHSPHLPQASTVILIRDISVAVDGVPACLSSAFVQIQSDLARYVWDTPSPEMHSFVFQNALADAVSDQLIGWKLYDIHRDLARMVGYNVGTGRGLGTNSRVRAVGC